MLAERFYTIDDLGDAHALIGSRAWCLWVANEIRKVIDTDDQVTQALRDLTTVFKEQQAWQELGCLSWEDFCERYLHRPAIRVDVALDLTGQTIVHAEKVRHLAEHTYGMGVAGPGRGHKTDDNNNVFSPETQGTSASYLTARIARDRPDILEDMKKGKYRSVRQAAIEAGIVNAKTRYSLPDDPAAAGRYLARRVDKKWFDSLRDAYYKAIEA